MLHLTLPSLYTDTPSSIHAHNSVFIHLLQSFNQLLVGATLAQIIFNAVKKHAPVGSTPRATPLQRRHLSVQSMVTSNSETADIQLNGDQYFLHKHVSVGAIWFCQPLTIHGKVSTTNSWLYGSVNAQK